MILTVDLGTTFTKAALFDGRGMVGFGRCAVHTSHPRPGWAEQDANEWWRSLVEAVGSLPSRTGVTAVGFAGARQTLVVVDDAGQPIAPAVAWSDSRADVQARVIAEGFSTLEPDAAPLGPPIDGRSVPAKLAWLAESGWLKGAARVLSPRDLLLAQMTGRVVTDATMASATSLYGRDGAPARGALELVAHAAGYSSEELDILLPPVVSPSAVVGGLRHEVAAALGLTPEIPVVAGAGDRACEVLGSGASRTSPVVSWGTTANVSVPLAAAAQTPAPGTTTLSTGADNPEPQSSSASSASPGLVTTVGAQGGWLLEAGLATAGAMVDWVAGLSRRSPDELMAMAAGSPPGARGLVAEPWLGGARAPWWRSEARGALVGLDASHSVGDVARAVVEGVALEVRRCLHRLAQAGAAGGETLCLGAGGTLAPWPEVLTAVTGCAATRRRSGQPALAGAALLAAEAVGQPLRLDDIDPVVEVVQPEPEATACYLELTGSHDEVARALVDLPLPAP